MVLLKKCLELCCGNTFWTLKHKYCISHRCQLCTHKKMGGNYCFDCLCLEDGCANPRVDYRSNYNYNYVGYRSCMIKYPYCHDHLCGFFDNDGGAFICPEKKADCTEHSCVVPDCLNYKMSYYSKQIKTRMSIKYCQVHSCDHNNNNNNNTNNSSKN